MAGDSVIGALRVVLGADTASLDRGLKDSQAGLASFGAGVGLAMAAAAASVAAAAYSIVGSIKSTIASADHLNSLSQSAGVSVEELSKLNYAAGLSDISTDSLATSLNKLTKSMNSVAQDGAGPAAQAFAALGVSVKNQDGSLKSSSAVLGEIADKLAGYRDGASKTALAVAIFGDAGARLIPLLNQGKEGLQAAGDEAQNFGLVLDKKTTLAAAAFHENLKKADAVTQGLIATIAARLLPTMEMLSEQWLAFSKDVDLSVKAIDFVANAINGTVIQAKIAVVELVAFGTQVGNLFNAIVALVKAPFDPAGVKAWNDYKAAAEQYGKEVDATVASIRSVGTASNEAFSAADWLVEGQALKSLNREVLSYIEAWKPAAPTIATVSDALKTFLDSQQKRAAAQSAAAETIGKSADQQARLRIEYEASAIAAAKGITITDGLHDAITRTADAASAAALKLEGAQLTQEMLAPWDLRNQKLLQYNTLLEQGAISQDTFTAAAQRLQFPAFTQAAQAAVDLSQRLGELTTNAIGGLSSALASIVTGTKSAAEAFKQFGIQVVTWLVEMIIKALIFKAIMVAIGFSGGGPVAMDQSLSSTGLQASATGGLYADGGMIMGAGTGTSDSIPAMLSNGEFVVNAQATKQWAPLLNAINTGKLPSFKDGGEVGYKASSTDGSASRGTVMVYIDAALRPLAEALIPQFNAAMRDGHELKLAPA